MHYPEAETMDKVIAVKRYNIIEVMTEWVKLIIWKLVDIKISNGTGAGLDLNMDIIRQQVTLDKTKMSKSDLFYYLVK